MNPALLIGRELGRPEGRALHLSEGLARKLAVEAVLDGHDGCVNRLAWNEDGSMLASASDDCKVILWHYPDVGRVPLALQTQHQANLFGVAFLPQHNNSRVISGAMDCTVQLHELDAGAFRIPPKYRSSGSGSSGSGSSGSGRNGAGNGMRRHPAAPQLHRVVPRTTVFRCHKSRVKEVEVSPQEPHLFWSAGEDGMIRQYDTRLPNQKTYGSANVLVSLAMAGPGGGLAECKGVDVNAAAPHLMAVACGDPYVRVFDRRRVSTDRPGKPTTPALLQLSAPHLPLLLKAGLSRRAHATHASFSSRGDRLVASYHGDHAYVFDVTGAGQQQPIMLPHQHSSRQQRQPSAAAAAAATSRRLSSSRAGYPLAAAAAPAGDDRSPATLFANLPEAAEAAKRAGNSALFEQRYTAAVAEFSAAIAAAPWVPGLYTQRALAWLKRGWEGDAAFALRDCEMAMALVQQAGGAAAAAAAAAEQQARLRQVHALKQLGQSQCALAALESYARHYPHAADRRELANLCELLQASVQQRQAHKAKLQQQRQMLLQRQAMQQRQRQAMQQRQRQQQRRTDAAAAAAVSPEQQRQQRAAAYLRSPPPPPPAAAAAAVDVAVVGGSESEIEGGGGSSSSLDPIGAGVEPPPGLGSRVETDIDSDEWENPPPPPAAAAAAAATQSRVAGVEAAAEAGSQSMDVDRAAREAERETGGESGDGDRHVAVTAEDRFVGPLVPPAIPVGEQQQQQQQQQQGGGLAGTGTAAAAEAAGEGVAAAAASGRLGAAVDDDAGSDDDGDDSDGDESADDDVSWLYGDAEAESDDELLMPWYGPTAYAQEQLQQAATAAAGSSMDPQQQTQQQQQQQQQQRQQGACSNGSSGSRRRPRSGSGSDEGCSKVAATAAPHLPGSPLAAAAAAAAPSNGRGRHHITTRAALATRSSSSSRRRLDSWWDVLSGGSGRLLSRCMGHCNVQTDIKEAVFVGRGDALVACGSDDGRVFIYSAETGDCVRVLPADEDVANCVRCHPTLPVLATSGIASVVRLWSPLAAADSSSCEAYVADNQSRMRDGPRLLRAAAWPPAALQAALVDENPQLLQLLVQQLYGMAATPRGAGHTAAVSFGAAAGTGAAPAARGAPAGAGEGLGVPRGHVGEGLGFGGGPGFDADVGAGSDEDDDEDGQEGTGQQQGGRRRQPGRGQGEDACRVS